MTAPARASCPTVSSSSPARCARDGRPAGADPAGVGDPEELAVLTGTATVASDDLEGLL
ncbi:hypothetical protein NKH77_56135 [Streptomyces sp. M19]